MGYSGERAIFSIAEMEGILFFFLRAVQLQCIHLQNSPVIPPKHNCDIYQYIYLKKSISLTTSLAPPLSLPEGLPPSTELLLWPCNATCNKKIINYQRYHGKQVIIVVLQSLYYILHIPSTTSIKVNGHVYLFQIIIISDFSQSETLYGTLIQEA